MNLGADLFSLSDPRAHKYAKPLPKAASWKMADELLVAVLTTLSATLAVSFALAPPHAAPDPLTGIVKAAGNVFPPGFQALVGPSLRYKFDVALRGCSVRACEEASRVAGLHPDLVRTTLGGALNSLLGDSRTYRLPAAPTFPVTGPSISPDWTSPAVH
eukprot:jgi/Tetstr1/464987/TSEL_009718.t1